MLAVITPLDGSNGTPENPIHLPPGIWPHPPGHRPPVVWDPAFPTNPIVLPPGPDVGVTPPLFPTVPIVLPPESGLPIVIPPLFPTNPIELPPQPERILSWGSAYIRGVGWVVVGFVRTGPGHPLPPTAQPK